MTKGYPNPQKKIHSKLFASKHKGKPKLEIESLTEVTRAIVKGKRILKSLEEKKEYYKDFKKSVVGNFMKRTDIKIKEVNKELKRLEKLLDKRKVKKEIKKIVKVEVKKEIKKEIEKVEKRLNKRINKEVRA